MCKKSVGQKKDVRVEYVLDRLGREIRSCDGYWRLRERGEVVICVDVVNEFE